MYSDKELELYDEYINSIISLIVDESINKFKLKVNATQINIGHIKKEKSSTSIEERWTFYYTITNKYDDNFEIWRGKPKVSGMTKQHSFNNWLLKKISDNRNNKLNQLGI